MPTTARAVEARSTASVVMFRTVLEIFAIARPISSVVAASFSVAVAIRRVCSLASDTSRSMSPIAVPARSPRARGASDPVRRRRG